MKYKITIPEPCHEDWSKMTPQEKGRFCDKCQKCVVDFTGFSTQQMFNHINAGKDLCGRFRPDQLNRELVDAPVKKGFSFQWALTSMLAFVGANDGFGQSQELMKVGKVVQVESSQNTEATISAAPIASDSLTISGTITDASTGEKLPYAYVVCSDLNIETVSDFDGNFTIELPSNEITDSTIISVLSLGYVTSEILIGKGFQNQTAKLNIQLHYSISGMVCIVKDTPWNRFKSWFRRVF